MKAAVLERFNHPLVVREVPDPVPADDEVVIKVRATGLCGTDLKLRSGDLASARLPVIPGHEVAGELTDDCGELRRGQPVACYMYEFCGRCRLCRLGATSLCPSLVRIGVERNGGLGEYMRLPARNVLPIPKGVPFAVAATCMDAVLTPWRGLRQRAGVQAGETVLVVGVGGLGLNGVQIARAAGARVVAIDPVASHRERAEQVGADFAVAPNEVESVLEWSSGGVDVALDSSGAPSGFATALRALRPGGRLVCVGYRVGTEYAFESSRIPLEEITILGARVGAREDATAVLEAVAGGVIAPAVADTLALGDVNAALRRLADGDVIGRIVIDVAGDGAVA